MIALRPQGVTPEMEYMFIHVNPAYVSSVEPDGSNSLGTSFSIVRMSNGIPYRVIGKAAEIAAIVAAALAPRRSMYDDTLEED